MLLCGFRKARSTQHALFKLLHSWQKELDNSGFVGTIFMDLSHAYDYLPHVLIIAMSEAYGLSKNSLKLLFDYLEGPKQRVKIDIMCVLVTSLKHLKGKYKKTLC